jgi:serine protease Do
VAPHAPGDASRDHARRSRSAPRRSPGRHARWLASHARRDDKPGSQATLTLWRGKSERKAKITVGELEDEPAVAALGPAGKAETGKLGLAVRPLSGSERERLRTIGRLVIAQADGPAAIAGVEAGDVLIAVNGVQVGTVAEFRKAVEDSGKTVALLIQRGNAQIFVPVRIDS